MSTDVEDDESDEAQLFGDAEWNELADSEFPHFFSERDGRLYQAETASSPYPLPVDTPENKRHRRLHNALRRLIGANYIDPVEQILEGANKLTIDLGCGTGQWIMEMAKKFPHVFFIGLDIVPIATRYPEENVRFELHDIGERMRWADQTVDFIHARSIFMTVPDYSVIIQEAIRLLRPGGLFLSGEWGQFPAFHPTFPQAVGPPSAHVPGLDRFYRRLQEVLAARGIISPVASTVHERLVASRAFTDVQEHIFYMPIGPWSPDPEAQTLGLLNRRALTELMNTVRPMFVAAGFDEAYLETLYSQCWTEIFKVSGLVSIYYLVTARRS
ncbi:S-adenosyl-L-methionine-dependent methyltransferase [Lentinula raphanica]|uniref:S-adenosyl-L-methionine-dependent methyltransferase n=1 Tax=Lentinula raphanica TaxID=153919 RepID=A0AA38P6F7_9AGAR|nr:S-adenosyl-L-methionine-dependent methyltransferase [Lentinula raphanica]KAJ3837056.1 S-adenosyl-L-methionine-dependent methyltransferase [Lentinula raphanica]KAJ3971994.1 S-adenosyl-L-methionine-dependent methyltransferase [Lentinula raphanica]